MATKIDVIIPHIDKQELLDTCLTHYAQCCDPNLTNVIVIDNGSSVPLVNNIYGSVVRMEENLGMVLSLEKAKELSTAEILIYTHSDMFYYDKGWDKKVADAFDADHNLGLLGVVGAQIASENGGRANVFCSFRGGHVHGNQTPAGVHAVALLDGCSMMFRRTALDSIEIDKKFYPHHFYDKDWSLEVLTHGWRVGVIAIDCEHLNGQVSCFGSYQSWANEYLKKEGIATDITGDLYFYYENEKRYSKKWNPHMPIIVSSDWSYKSSRMSEAKMLENIQQISSAWKGHENFAVKLVKHIRPKTIVELGVDLGFSSIALAIPNIGKVYGIDWFKGDAHAGYKENPYERALAEIEKIGLNNVELIVADFTELAKTWDKPIDILHIDGFHEYEAVKRDWNNWVGFVKDTGVIIFHDTESFPDDVGRFFNEIQLPKFKFTHSHGLGVVAKSEQILMGVKNIGK